jgi:hypothetical protein
VGALRGEGPEVPLAVVVGPAGVSPTFLGVDEIGELGRVPNEEDRSVIADQVVVALLRVDFRAKPRGSRTVSGKPCSPATVENRATIGVRVPCFKKSALHH